jgi:hypothetical protein
MQHPLAVLGFSILSEVLAIIVLETAIKPIKVCWTLENAPKALVGKSQHEGSTRDTSI